MDCLLCGVIWAEVPAKLFPQSPSILDLSPVGILGFSNPSAPVSGFTLSLPWLFPCCPVLWAESSKFFPSLVSSKRSLWLFPNCPVWFHFLRTPSDRVISYSCLHFPSKSRVCFLLCGLFVCLFTSVTPKEMTWGSACWQLREGHCPWQGGEPRQTQRGPSQGAQERGEAIFGVGLEPGRARAGLAVWGAGESQACMQGSPKNWPLGT